MTTLLMITLHDLTHMPELLEAWKRIGVPGVTILNSMGGFQASELVRSKGLGGFLKMFEEVRSGQRIGPAQDPLFGECRGGVETGHLAEGMHTLIGAAGGYKFDRVTQDRRQRDLELTLGGAQHRLALPTVERGTVVLNRQADIAVRVTLDHRSVPLTHPHAAIGRGPA